MDQSNIWSRRQWVKVTQNATQYPLRRVTYAPAKLEVVMSNHLGGDAFTRKFIIRPMTLTKGSRLQ